MPKTKPKLFTVKEAGKLFANHPRADTIRAWMRTGVKNPKGGDPVILQSQEIGARTYTTAEWVEVFIAACQKPTKVRDRGVTP